MLALLPIIINLPLTVRTPREILDCPAFGAIVLGPNVLLCHFCLLSALFARLSEKFVWAVVVMG
ncbi:MAG: hypothetical protein WA705_23240 [Candidatus Ozemobacteraceae bacterium]